MSISIIIPAYNQHDLTRECIAAVRDHEPSAEIVLIDNGSTPPYMRADADRVLRNEQNAGFPVAVNQGIRYASGDYIILLNNDVIVTERFASYLIGHLINHDIVAPMTNYCAGLQRVQIPLYFDRASLDDRARAYTAAHIGAALPVRWVIGFCMAFRKSLWTVIGRFDEDLWPCSGEEIDFCLRANEADYSVAIAKDVYVHHYGSQTFRAMENAGQTQYHQIIERNNAHLAKKWGEEWQSQK